MIKYSSIIQIIRTSFLCFAIGFLTQAQSSAPTTMGHEVSVARSNIANGIKADVGERSFWDGIPLPSTEMRLIIFEADNAKRDQTVSEFDALAIVPELNSVFEYRFCSGRVLLVSEEQLWITWSPWQWSPGGKRLSSDEYMAQQMSRFSDFTSHAKRQDQDLAISSDPAELFHVDPQFRTRRIAQIQHAAMEMLHKRLQIRVANFSQFTDKIDAVLPGAGEMVTFTVHRSCSGEDTVEWGKDLPLKSIRVDLRKRIEANSSVVEIE